MSMILLLSTMSVYADCDQAIREFERAVEKRAEAGFNLHQVSLDYEEYSIIVNIFNRNRDIDNYGKYERDSVYEEFKKSAKGRDYFEHMLRQREREANHYKEEVKTHCQQNSEF